MSDQVEIIPPASHPSHLEPNTPEEEIERAELLAIIKPGLANFITTGNALTRFRDKRLYKNTHHTFAEFCEQEFGISCRRAYQLIEASETATKCEKIFHIPNEGVAHELSKLPEKQQVKVAKFVAMKTKKTQKPVTAAIVKEVAKKYNPDHHKGGLYDQMMKAKELERQQQTLKKGSSAEIIEATFQAHRDEWRANPITIRTATDIYIKAVSKKL